MNVIERAFNAVRDVRVADVRREFENIVGEMMEAREQAMNLWSELLAREGLKPEDLMRRERLMPSDENESLAKAYDLASKKFVQKMERYKEACKLLGVEPVILKEAKERYERNQGNNSNNRVTKTNRRRGQPAGNGYTRVSRRGQKRLPKRRR